MSGQRKWLQKSGIRIHIIRKQQQQQQNKKLWLSICIDSIGISISDWTDKIFFGPNILIWIIITAVSIIKYKNPEYKVRQDLATQNSPSFITRNLEIFPKFSLSFLSLINLSSISILNLCTISPPLIVSFALDYHNLVPLLQLTQIISCPDFVFVMTFHFPHHTGLTLSKTSPAFSIPLWCIKQQRMYFHSNSEKSWINHKIITLLCPLGNWDHKTTR